MASPQTGLLAALQVDGVHPIHEDYGLYEGTPIARYYINRYVQALSGRLSGRVLEFGWPTYAARIACDYEIFDIDPANPRATIRGDICDPGACRAWAGRFDAIICTTVLQLVDDPPRAVANMRTMLREGGSLVLAEKALSRIDPWATDVDRWRFTPYGLAHLLRGFATVEVETRGNVFAICAYMLGLPAERLEPARLAEIDPRHPVVTLAHARK